MKQILTLAAAIMAFAITTNATVWRVNNVAGTDADFTTIQAAHNAAYVYAGDTIYLEASSASYGNLIATKKLIIIGSGYFLTQNPNTQANQNISELGDVTFNNGSQGSIIQGCVISRLAIGTSNLLIQRNYISFSSTSNGTIYFSANNISNIIIRNNYLLNNYSSVNQSAVIYNTNTGINNIIITNNFIAASRIYNQQYALNLQSGFSGTIENNVIYGRVSIFNAVFNNNILREGEFSSSNSVLNNNLANGSQFGNENGNQSNVNMFNVFLGAGSTDGQWKLKQGSPAIGAGVGGIDCGMFGGEFPYILSGLPGIPSIYFHEQTIDNVNQELHISIKAKSHN
jgi:hypothetical protein